jgi:RNA polymerase sigma-70 factor (ECF subfamily)
MPLAFDADEYEAVDERLQAGSLGPALRAAVDRLPSDQRAALELRVVEQLDYDEVAGRLGITVNAARLRVSRALRALTLRMEGAQG